MATGIDASGEVVDVITRQEGFHGEVVEVSIHVIVLVADIVIAVAAHRAAASSDAQVAGYPSAAFLADLTAHLHRRQFHVFQAEHLVQHRRVAQVHLGIEVSLHAVHIGRVVDGALTLDSSQSRDIGIQRLHVDTFVVATGLCLDFDRLVVRQVLEGFACLRNQFLDLVKVNLAVGVDSRFAIGFAIKHVLIDMGIQLDVTTLCLDARVVEVQAVLILAHGTAGILDL